MPASKTLSALFKWKKADVKLEDVQQIIDADPEDAKTADGYGLCPLHLGMVYTAPADSISVVF